MKKRPSAASETAANVSSEKAYPHGLVIHPKTGRRGAEIVDGQKMAQALNYQKRPSIVDQLGEIRRIAREEASRFAETRGAETFEEADDFNVPDDDDPMPESPYEGNFDPIPKDDMDALHGRASPPKRTREEPSQPRNDRASSSKPRAPEVGEGAEGGSPDPSPSDPASERPVGVRSYFRRAPEPKRNGD